MKKKLIAIIILLTTFNSIAHSQENSQYIPWLEEEILKYKHIDSQGNYDIYNCDSIINYCYYLRILSKCYADVDITKSIKCELKHLTLQRKYGCDSDSLTSFSYLGRYYKDNEDYTNARFYFHKALLICEEQYLIGARDERLVDLFMGIASLYAMIDKPDSAFIYSEMAKKIELSNNGEKSKKYATIEMNSALYKFQSGDIQYCLSHLRQLNKRKHSDLLIAANMAGIYNYMNDADSCYIYLSAAYRLIQNKILSNMANMSKENRFTYFSTERTIGLITLPVYYFLLHTEHKGLKELAFNSILFYKNLCLEITRDKYTKLRDYVTLKDVKKELKEDEIAIELWSDHFDFWHINHILAFIVTPQKDDIKFVAISKDSIDMALNNKIETSSTFLPLYETVWKKLIDNVSLAREGKIFISCDDIYTFIPIENICNYDFEYMDDIYSIVRVSHLKNIHTVKKKHKIKNVALFGGLEFDCRRFELMQDVLVQSSSSNMEINDTTLDNYRDSFRYLYWSKVEVDSICDILRHHIKHNKLRVYTGTEGNVDSFQALSGNSPSVIHLATHGQSYQATTETSWLDYYQNVMENSGIMLSCAVDSSLNNGFLSSKKIGQLDLSKTDLLVLSACNTGLGGATPYGIFGLQQAFKQAGVGSIIMALNKVSDAATCLFINEFYKAITLGMTYRDAFKTAQYAIRSNDCFKDFSYWAYFIMID